MTTVDDLAEAGEAELVRLLGKAHGASLHRMAIGLDDRPVVAERDAKSVSVEDTFDMDLHDRVRVRTEVERLADRCVQRLRGSRPLGAHGGAEGAPVRLLHADPLRDAARAHGRPGGGPRGRRPAAGVRGHHRGVRLLGVGVTGLADFTQEDLFAQAAGERAAAVPPEDAAEARPQDDTGGHEGPAEPEARQQGPDNAEQLAARR